MREKSEKRGVEASLLLSFVVDYIVSASELLGLGKSRVSVSAIFCLRHSIELLQKSLTSASRKKFNRNHELNKENLEMAKTALNKIKLNDQNPAIKKRIIPFLEEISKNENPEKIFKVIMKGFSQKLGLISKKYQTHSYLNLREKINDRKNIYLRYPKNQEFLDNLEIANLERIRSDVTEVLNMVAILVFFFSLTTTPLD